MSSSEESLKQKEHREKYIYEKIHFIPATPSNTPNTGYIPQLQILKERYANDKETKVKMSI